MTVIYAICILVAIIYLLFILKVRKGWMQIETNSELNTDHTFSIIIAARNEEKEISSCLKSLGNLNYPQDKFEVIFINDASQDRTEELIEEFIKGNPNISAQLILNSTDEPGGKKKSIEKGVKLASNDIIITTDADCKLPKLWLQSHSAALNQGVNMVSAPVVFENENGFFAKYQKLEFQSLIAIGAASIFFKAPNLSNGANLSYRKSLFNELAGFKNVDHIASGDDELFMHKVHARYPGTVKFLKSKNALVSTKSFSSVGAFFSQRRRWASKHRYYKSLSTKAVLFFAYLYHVALLFSFFYSFISTQAFFIFLILFLVKIISEFTFIKTISGFFHLKKCLPYYPLSAFMYIFYVSIIGIIAQIGTYNWKGRKLK